MANATVNRIEPMGGAPLAAGGRLKVLKVTAPAGADSTFFDVADGDITTNTLVLGIIPMDADAAGLAPWNGGVSTGNLRISFVSTTLLGTEVFHIAILVGL